MSLRHVAKPVGVRLAGVGMAVPPRCATNDDLSKIVDTSDEWIRPRTGIKQRHLSDEGLKTSDLAAQAVTMALEDAGISPNDLDLLFCATMTPDMVCPATACQVVAKIGAVPCGAMDINMACTGFVGALNMASNAIASGMYKNVAVIGADQLSTIVNWEDRRTCVLFGDAAGAAVLTASDNANQGCLYQRIWSDASKADALYIPRDEKDLPANIDATNTDEPGWNGQYDKLQMDGRTVFKFAVNALKSCVQTALQETGLTPDDIAMVIPHQSNIRMLQTAWKKLGFDDDKIYINIDRFGNTSAASIGLCLYELKQQKRLHEGDKVIFVAQGGGLTWGVSAWEL